MPLYEYECKQCGQQFEVLVLPGRENRSACASCGSTELTQLLSSFAVSSDTTRKANLTTAREKSKKVQVDKEMAEIEYIEHHHDPEH